jgi:hypothetical protein
MIEPRKRGFLAMPFLGFHSYRNASATGYDPACASEHCWADGSIRCFR